MSGLDLSTAAMGIAGAPNVRPGDATDAIDGVVPRIVVSPETAETLAATLAWASSSGLPTVIRGAGTKRAWGRPPDRIDVVVETRRLNRVLAHEHGDLTATIEAGALLREVNEVLSARGQFLPLDPSFDRSATIGGVLATNDSGPLRHRYGSPRDLAIGIRLATTDGVLAKAGGRVVKNVAGYDLSKLVIGSCGTLAAIVSATFKLSPLPDSSRTIVARPADAFEAGAWVQAILRSQIEPQVFEVAADERGISIALRFASIAESVSAQIAQARALLQLSAAHGPQEVGDADEQRYWEAHALAPPGDSGAVLRVSWLPAALAEAIASIGRAAEGARPRLIGRAALGSGLLRIEGDEAALIRAIVAIRSSAVFRHVVIMNASPGVKRRADVWGSPGDHGSLLASLKRTFDPAGVLNAARGPL